MRIFVPKETHPGELRVPLIPATVKQLVDRGAEVQIEAGMGVAAQHTDDAYTEAGATVVSDRDAALAEAELVLRLRKPPAEDNTVRPTAAREENNAYWVAVKAKEHSDER